MSTSLLPTTAELDRLAEAMQGRLVRPDDPDWDGARQAWHLSVDQRPTAVALVASVDDVRVVVRAATELGLRVAAQATGHNAAPLGPLANTVLLKTSALRGVVIDAERQCARVEAGALWMDVTGPAGAAGLAALAGSAPDVGVVGYTLGGGLSWLGRSHGLAANSVLAIELVTADGEHRRVDEQHEPELFWALRGGGGSFGIVTAMEFRLYPVAEVHAGVLFWPIEAAREVLHAYREWVASVPTSVTSVGRLLRFPPLPDLPDHLRGQAFVVVEAACQLPAAAADELLAPLRALRPQLDTFGPTPVAQLGALHMDPDGPVPAFGDGMLLADLPAAAIDAFVDAAGQSGSPLLSAELRHLGGALTPGACAGGAVSGIEAGFAMFGVGITPDDDADRAVRESVDLLHRALAPWSSGGSYLNFAERPKAGAALFGEATFRRLQSVKAEFDPADVIRANHSIPPAGGA